MAYKVNISDLAYKKITHWVAECPKEISGFGTVEFDVKTKEFNVLDAFLIEQTVGSAHTDIDGAGLGKLMYKTRAAQGELKFWWHSHVNMATFWSSQDLKTILELGGNGWIVASVFNKKEEVRTAIAYQATSALNNSEPETVFYDELATFILRPALDKTFTDELNAQMKELVKDEPYRTSNYTPSKGGGGGNGKSSQYNHGNWGDWDERDAWDEYYKQTEETARGNITDATKSNMADPNSFGPEGYFTMKREQLTEFELDQLCEVGAFGFGFDIECKTLGLTKKAFRRILRRNDMKQLLNLEDICIKAEAAGEIKAVVTKMHQRSE